MGALSFSSDGRRLVAAGARELCSWSLEDGRLEHRHPLPSPGINVKQLGRRRSDDRVLIPGSLRNGLLTVWDARNDRVESLPMGELGPLSAVSGADGRCLAVLATPGASGEAGARRDSGVSLEIYDRGRRLNTLPELSGAFAFTGPDSAAMLAARSGTDLRRIALIDVESRRVKAWLEGHSDEVYALAFTPDGGRLASAGRDSLRLWDCETGEEIVQLRGHRSFIAGLRFSPDGSQLASAAGDREVRIWDTRSVAEVARSRSTRRAILNRLQDKVDASPSNIEGLAQSDLERELLSDLVLQRALKR